MNNETNKTDKPLTWNEWTALFFPNPSWRVRPYAEFVRASDGYKSYLANHNQ